MANFSKKQIIDFSYSKTEKVFKTGGPPKLKLQLTANLTSAAQLLRLLPGQIFVCIMPEMLLTKPVGYFQIPFLDNIKLCITK